MLSEKDHKGSASVDRFAGSVLSADVISGRWVSVLNGRPQDHTLVSCRSGIVSSDPHKRCQTEYRNERGESMVFWSGLR
jgi:hypothetical protein